MRRALAAGAAVLALLLVTAVPAAASDPVKDRQAAQQRANAAAAKFAAATTQLAKAEQQVAALEAKAKANEDRVAALQQRVKNVAINSYVRGNTTTFAFDKDLSRTARTQALARMVTLGDTDSLDAYRAARQDLDLGRGALAKQLATRRAAAAKLRDQKQAAYKELSRLAAIEKTYLAKIEAQKRAAAATRTALSAKQASRGATGVIASGEWVCPVQGPRAFSNDYGQPRSGGRSHEGTDILSPMGTPVVAPVAGIANDHMSSLGGPSFYLTGDDGNTYFGTHLSAYAATGRVAAGTVIGYVGDSGNARGTPHLHFEIHPGGGGPVNPYPTLSRYC